MHAANTLGKPPPAADAPTRHGADATRGRPATLRRVLGTLLAFGALSAFDGGYYGLSGAKGVPRQWLAGSPFSDYVIPSLVLLAVGGTLLLASLAVFARWPRARLLSVAAAVVLLGWLAVQLSILGYVSWMQPATALFAGVLLTLGLLLPGPGNTRA